MPDLTPGTAAREKARQSLIEVLRLAERSVARNPSPTETHALRWVRGVLAGIDGIPALRNADPFIKEGYIAGRYLSTLCEGRDRNVAATRELLGGGAS